ncbi:hypothetical protein OSTOST_08926, partial [Ostertagia ostertagi]
RRAVQADSSCHEQRIFVTVLLHPWGLYDGTVIPLLFAFIPDGKVEMYRHLFRFFWDILGGIGLRHALMPPTCTFLFDFELPAINAATIEMPIVVKGCFFHYTQAIIRHHDVASEGSSIKESCHWSLLPTHPNAAVAAPTVPQGVRSPRGPAASTCVVDGTHGPPPVYAILTGTTGVLEEDFGDYGTIPGTLGYEQPTSGDELKNQDKWVTYGKDRWI